MHHYHDVSCCLFEALAGAKGVELACTHFVGLNGDRCIAILVWLEEVGVTGVH